LPDLGRPEKIKPVTDENDSSDCNLGDVMSVGPADPGPGRRFRRHLPDHSIEEGTIFPCQEGQALPPGADLIRLKKRADGDFDVETVVSGRGHSTAATPAYRSGWDRIFGGSTQAGQA
jgi:hypothetical protein